MKKFYSFLKKIAKAPILFYKKYISNNITPSCKYFPSCSSYAIDAIDEWGIVIGYLLAIYRILRCNPFSKGGFDPVPKRKNKKTDN